MSVLDQWFWIICNIGIFVSCLLLLDAAHRAHIAALKQMQEAELEGMRTYIRTLNRERKWLENELAKAKRKVAKQQEQAATAVPWMADHIFLPPSEEYDEDD